MTLQKDSLVNWISTRTEDVEMRTFWKSVELSTYKEHVHENIYRKSLTTPEACFFSCYLKQTRLRIACFVFPRFLVQPGLNYNYSYYKDPLGTLKEKYQNDSIKGKAKHGLFLVIFPQHYRVKL